MSLFTAEQLDMAPALYILLTTMLYWPTAPCQLSLMPQQKGREHSFLRVHNIAMTSPHADFTHKRILPNVLEVMI